MKSRKKQKSPSSFISTVVIIALFLITVTAAILYFSDTDPRDVVNTVGEQLGQEELITDDSAILPKATLESIGTPVPNPQNSAVASSSQNLIYAFDDSDFSRVLPRDGQLSVIVLDVGKGDSIFVRTPNGKNMLIDTGTSDYWERLQFYFDQLGVTKFDAVIATHPHSDHIGSMSKVLKNYEVDTLYMPRVSHTSNTYKKLLETIAKKNMKVIALEGGKNQTIALDPDLTIDVLAPLSNNYEELNDHSGVIRIQYGNQSMLLTGDAEKTSELDMVNFYGNELKSDVLKVPHHGSKTSSRKEFLDAVSPTDAIISTAIDNEYKHPHQQVLDRLEKRNINIYRTDLNSSVGIFFDKDKHEIVTAKP